MYYRTKRVITFTGTLNHTENDWWLLVMASAELLDG